MSRVIMLVPIGNDISLTNISIGIIHAIEKRGFRPSFFKPISQSTNDNEELDKTVAIVRKNSNILIPEPLKMGYVENLLYEDQEDILMEKIFSNYYTNYYTNNKETEIVLIEGLMPIHEFKLAQSLNYKIAKMLNAGIIFVTSNNADNLKQIKEYIKPNCTNFINKNNFNIAGIIFNELNIPFDEQDHMHFNLSETSNNYFNLELIKSEINKFIKNCTIPIVGIVPYNLDLAATRAIDIANHLNATVINRGDIKTRRVKSITLCEYNISRILENFQANSLMVISADHPEMLIAICLAAISGREIGAVLLTGGELDIYINKLCEYAFFTTGLPVFMVRNNTWKTFLKLKNLNLEIPTDDSERIENIKEYVAKYINIDWISSLSISMTSNYDRNISPINFRYQLTKLARKANKRIVLPEGNEPRTLKAASICANRGIATCVLLGNQDEINRVATSQGIKLGLGIEIVDPEKVRENYVNRLFELRKNRGITKNTAREQLEDNVILGTLMLEQGKVDGLVSGANHTTANTIRPSLQLIKTAPGNSLVSSVFFMLLPEQVYVYGDCAINQNPTAEQLAEIAIQSADSAATFGINPLVAMLSYSTYTSGIGRDVDKVREATYLAQKKRPDIIIDGPLQYDAAVTAEVAKRKAPNSIVAGRATVFIFPDLNTGNITYKAVQRSANLISIGPMLQGMRKPVNDLSRGALVDDIVYTIALTAVQATQ